MNGSISITLSTPTIILEFHAGYGQCNLLQTNDMKEEKVDIKEEKVDIKEEKVDIKEEKVDIKEEVIDITKEEFDFDCEMNEYILHKDPNLYLNLCSPISNAESENVENNQSSISEDQDENFDVFYKKYCDDIFEIMQYLKEDIV
jgi:hypothetical protein